MQKSSVDPSDIISKLVQDNILVENKQEYVFSDRFYERILELKENKNISTKFEAEYNKYTQNLIEPEYVALSEMDSLSSLERQYALTIFDAFYSGRRHRDGTPHACLDIRGSRLPFISETYKKSIVYIWRDDCKPCDKMKKYLNKIYSDIEVELPLFSIYGPNSKNILLEKYNIKSGPILLFFRDNEIDCRIQGLQTKCSVKTEIMRHRSI